MNAPDAKNPPNSSIGPRLTHGELTVLVIRLEELYDAGTVKRCHSVPTQRTHTIAEHVYGSMLLAVELVRLNVGRSGELCLSISMEQVLMGLLYHDAPELETGDVPAPVKRSSPAINMALEDMEQRFYSRTGTKVPLLNVLEADIVKAADTLDLCFLCVRERVLGNRHPKLARMFQRALEYAYEKQHLRGVEELRRYLHQLWAEVH